MADAAEEQEAARSEDPDARISALNNLPLAHGAAGEFEAALRNNPADLLHAAGQEAEPTKRPKQAVKNLAEVGEEGALQPEIWKPAER